MLDVIIAGAGPVGLWLSAELRLQGLSVAVVEPKTAPDERSRGFSMQSGTLDTFATRGIVDRFLERGIASPTGHFGATGVELDFRDLGTPYPFMLALGQAMTERLLQEYAESLGVHVLRGHRVVSVSQDNLGGNSSGVEVALRSEQGHRIERAGWLVGCDGTQSTVRQEAGIPFTGTTTSLTGILADITLDNPPDGLLSVASPAGSLLIIPLGDGVFRVAGVPTAEMDTPLSQPVSLDEVRRFCTQVLGHDMGMRSPLWLSRYGNATRQAERYRSGRVFVAGDAAHMFFPAGGQGMNVGLQDATNLGWKLAGAVNGWAPTGLLDSYEAERQPAGEAVLHNSRAQVALFTARTPEQLALRDVFSAALRDPEINRRWARQIAGFDDPVVAQPPDAHPLCGRRIQGLVLRDEATRTVHSLLRHGGFVLLDLTQADPALPVTDSLPIPLATHHVPLDVEASDPMWTDVTAVLVRPDCRVGWATTEPDPRRRAAEALAAVRSWSAEATD